MADDVEDVRDPISWVWGIISEAIERAARTRPGQFGAAWATSDGTADSLETFGQLKMASRNHAAAEGAVL